MMRTSVVLAHSSLRKAVRSFTRSPTSWMAEATATSTSSSDFIINFVTPHAPIFNKKVVESVILPGAAGEYGVSFGHSPIISQLEPGVVTVIHVGGTIEKYFVPGGFAITQANSVTDISVPEAVPLSDFDETAIRSSFAEATSLLNSSSDGSTDKVTAMIQLNTFSAIGRALGITL